MKDFEMQIAYYPARLSDNDIDDVERLARQVIDEHSNWLSQWLIDFITVERVRRISNEPVAEMDAREVQLPCIPAGLADVTVANALKCTIGLQSAPQLSSEVKIFLRLVNEILTVSAISRLRTRR